MTPVVLIAFLTLSLNNTPPGMGPRGGGSAKFPPRPTKPKPPPPDKPSEERPDPPPHDQEEPQPSRPDYGTPLPVQAPQYREEPHLAVIRRNLSQVNSCFESARSWSSTIQGEVVVEWEIGEAGDVQKAEVTGNTTGKPDLANCILQAVKGWRFNEPNTTYPTHVRHAFRLQTY
ncbi:MAG TPA: AgmX/PglI C-terminal domain-containing protein [Hyalangium sp.]|jgi:TonB family protein|nr:AgmX/PglI C-terminal domain-containing protein [Hyalangium sp.]